MAVDQSNPSRATGLLVPFEPDGEGPAHARLAAALRSEVTRGRLRPGDRLPPSRALAEDLGLSRWVVTEAYDQLKAEGYLSARVGAGTVVADGVAAACPPPLAPVAVPVAGDGVLDLSPSLPDVASFPRALWRAALARALAEVPDAALAHPDPQGAPALRATLADYLRRVRGVGATADRVHVTPGVRSAVLLLCAVLRAAGARRVAVEDPSWPRLREAVRAGGLEAVPVPVDGLGMQVDRLPGLAVDAVFTTPTHQFPTGVPLDAARRGALMTWAARGGLVVEDDYDAEFRYDRRPVGALAALPGEHVVHLGSVSKSLSPALHLGWLVAPDRLSGPLAAARLGTPGPVPVLDQHALAHLVATGAYDRHLRRMRRHYRQRREAFLAALARHVPGRCAPGMDAGLHVLWLLPDGADEASVVAALEAQGVAVLGLGRCREADGPPGLVLGYANVAPHRADAVAARLGAAVTVRR